MSLSPAPRKLSPDLLLALHNLKPVQRFPEGATLFQQGSLATGVFLVASGEVCVLRPDGQNQRQILDIVGPETLLGLSECMTSETYRITAIASDETIAVFIPREDFVDFLRQHCDFCVQIARRLSEDLHRIYHKFRNITAHPGRPRNRSFSQQFN
ncbi:MAG: cyclic nucleotide-binding domain-containing protein [Terriglobales bacterium]